MPISKASGQAVAPAAKGDLVVGSATNDAAVLSVGSADQVLTVDSSTTTGLKWATPSAGGMTLISTTTLTGASVTISSIPSTYLHLQAIIVNFVPATDSARLLVRMNADSTASRHRLLSNGAFGSTSFDFFENVDNAVSQFLGVLDFPYYANTTTWKICRGYMAGNDPTTTTSLSAADGAGAYNQTAAISSIQLLPNSGNFTSGTVYLYGVK